jgi:hypothetical protein
MQNNNTTNFQESKFCSKCINFYANPKLGNLCSKCFNDSQKQTDSKSILPLVVKENILELTTNGKINEIKKLTKTEDIQKEEKIEIQDTITKAIQVTIQISIRSRDSSE